MKKDTVRRVHLATTQMMLNMNAFKTTAQTGIKFCYPLVNARLVTHISMPLTLIMNAKQMPNPVQQDKF
jgi:hypothetical protein